MEEHELLLAPPRKISFLLEKSRKVSIFPVKKQNAPWNSLRSPRRVLFFHRQNLDFSRIFLVRTRFYSAAPSITPYSGPVSKKTAPKWNCSRAKMLATNELFLFLEPSQLCNHTFWHFWWEIVTILHVWFLPYQTWRLRRLLLRGACLDWTNEESWDSGQTAERCINQISQRALCHFLRAKKSLFLTEGN